MGKGARNRKVNHEVNLMKRSLEKQFAVEEFDIMDRVVEFLNQTSAWFKLKMFVMLLRKKWRPYVRPDKEG